jgi:predicted flap endonuclease-1-like 5' DNA nuclease
MPQIALEVFLGILLAFFVGCILGYVLRLVVHRAEEGTIEENIESSDSVAAEPAAVEHEQHMRLADRDPPQANAAKSHPVVPETSTAGYTAANGQAEIAHTEPRPEEAALRPSQPKGIASPRGGTADELQQISGVGPKIELTLHRLGIFHFDQIAGWTTEEVQWVDDHLKFKGRIARDEWIKQARQFASGRTNERAPRSGKQAGSKSAKPKSPARTRRS